MANESRRSKDDDMNSKKSDETKKMADLERTQENQKGAAAGNNPHSETGPAENLRAKAAKAEDKSDSSRDAT